MDVSAVIIAKNEEENIKDLLDLLTPYLDEIVVVDDYSEDRTREIAENNPKTRVFKKKLERFDEQRNYGAQKASNEWVLQLDADERPSKELLERIRDLINTDKYDAYSFHVIGFDALTGEEVKVGYPRIHTKLFKKSKAWYQGYVHEHVRVKGKLKFVPLVVKHYGAKGGEHRAGVGKKGKNIEMMEKERRETPILKRFAIDDLLYPLRYFWNIYFYLKLGFFSSLIYTYRYMVRGVKKKYLKKTGY